MQRALAAAGLLLAMFPAAAQSDTPTTLPSVTVSTPAPEPVADVGGFGRQPLSRSPFQADVIGNVSLKDRGVESLARLTAFDPSIGDSYNALGYWSTFLVRGYPISYTNGFRRNGLPISGETVLELTALQQVEVLKGLSGIQAGTSAPGGLVNLVPKRPDGSVRSARLVWEQPGTHGVEADVGDRFGIDQAFGLRLNLASARLDPSLRDAKGERQLLALAADWRLAPGSLLEAELEHSHRSQPSQPAFSLLGDRLPDARAVDPRINLNNQPWSQPVVFDDTTASLRWTQQLDTAWTVVSTLQTQRLRTDDRLAFPYGCSSEDHYDRYCSDGTYDVYLYRSDNEHRRTDAADVHLDGRFATGSLAHELSFGVQWSNFRTDLRTRPDDGTPVGVGNVDGTAVITQDQIDAIGLGTVTPTNRYSRSTEWYLRDRIAFDDATALWAGLRYTRMAQGLAGVPDQPHYSFTTPWFALTRQLDAATMVYASWGQGIETSAAPNRGEFVNANQPLPALRSRQLEAGLKYRSEPLDASVAVFGIHRPLYADEPANDDGTLLRRVPDGDQHHRGLEGALTWRPGPWTVDASAMFLRARVEDAKLDATINGERPYNVPSRSARFGLLYDVSSWPGLQVGGRLVYEGPRMATPDNSIEIASWTRLDLQARWQQRVGSTTLTWRAGVYNATDRRAWRESPYQYSHVYLYPMEPRTLRASVQIDL